LSFGLSDEDWLSLLHLEPGRRWPWRSFGTLGGITHMANSSTFVSDVLPALLLTFAFGVVGYFIFRWLRRIGTISRGRQRQGPLPSYPHHVIAKIMDRIGPMERGSKYGDPLVHALVAQRMGTVTGGGTQMDKAGAIVWVGLDLELADLEGALHFTQQRLRELGAPGGSLLEYRIGDQKVTVQIA